jgi:imidazolonepropionase-like amidohydrolase
MRKTMKAVLVVLACASLGISAGIAAPENPRAEGKPGPLVLERGSVFDGRVGRFRAGRTLIIEKGLIADEFASGQKPLPSRAEIIDLGGKFVIPGLIDAHVHIASDPSGDDRRERIETVLLKALRGGVTFVRDMAGDGRALADLGRAIAAGDIVAPGLRYAALMAGPGFFSDPRTIMSAKGEVPGRTPWGRAVSETTDLVLAVAEGRGTGASAIKIYTQVDPKLLARIVAEAHRQGLAVWSHATVAPSRPGDAVSAGVDVISHADHLVWEAMPRVDPGPRGLPWRWVDEDVRRVPPDHPSIAALFKRMKDQGTVLDATVGYYRGMLKTSEKDYPRLLPVAKARAAFAFGVTRLAHELGVAVCAGTDGILETPDAALPALHMEMLSLVEDCGFTPAAALIAATLDSARAVGISKTLGTIEPGKAADLVVLRADPTADIRNAGAIELVIKSGRPVSR